MKLKSKTGIIKYGDVYKKYPLGVVTFSHQIK